MNLMKPGALPHYRTTCGWCIVFFLFVNKPQGWQASHAPRREPSFLSTNRYPVGLAREI